MAGEKFDFGAEETEPNELIKPVEPGDFQPEGGPLPERTPRTREELRSIITHRRGGQAPTEEQLDHIERAEQEGKWWG